MASTPTTRGSSSLQPLKRFYLYVITRRETGKRYFGFTSEEPKQRWWRHKNHAVKGDGYAIHDAIRKHGSEAFDFLVLAEFTSLEAAREAEVTHIAEHKTNCRRDGHFGYNLTDGGEGASGYTHSNEVRARISRSKRGQPAPWARAKKSEATKAKLSASHRGKSLSPQHLASIRKAAKLRRGKPSPNKGRNLSVEMKQHLSVKLKEHFDSNYSLASQLRVAIVKALTSGPTLCRDLITQVLSETNQPVSKTEYVRNVLLSMVKSRLIEQPSYGWYSLP